jgi:hypothetical protein
MSAPRDDVVVVALVPAKDRADSVAATVEALWSVDVVDRVVVIDDGSTDATTEVARAAGADVVRLGANRGKGGAVRAGVEATPEADVYVLVDADVADTARLAGQLVGPVLSGDADMTIGVLPAAGSRGGFGRVRELARWGIRRACGRQVRAPLSGQRAVRASLLREMGAAERFGLEVGLTIDAVRAGASVVEVDIDMDHRHTGRSVAGFSHRARQGGDVLAALWPRLTTARSRMAIVALALVVTVAAITVTSLLTRPASVPATRTADQVVVFGITRLGLGDLDSGAMPTLDGLVEEGALAATTVRTVAVRPTPVEAYATISSGSRVVAGPAAEIAMPPDAKVEGSTAAEVVARRTGIEPTGDVVVVGGPATLRFGDGDTPGGIAALADALHGAGKRTAVVGNSDLVDQRGERVVQRPAAVAAMDSDASVDVGAVGPGLLEEDPAAPFGIRTDDDAFMAEVERGLAEADLLVVDPGEMERAAAYSGNASEERAAELRQAALRHTDRLLARVVAALDEDALLLVVAVTPPTGRPELTPTVAYGAGVTPGHLHSLSTKRPDLVTLTDVAPTVLAALDVERPKGMIGRPLRYRPGTVQLGELERADAVAAGRETLYAPMVRTFIFAQAAFYLFAALVLALVSGPRRLARFLRLAALTFAAWPVATFLYRVVPAALTIGALAHLLMWLLAVAIALFAERARGHPLAPLARVAGLTLAVLVVDVATGAHLQMASILGYSPHVAARFSGLGNTAYGVLAAAAIVAAAVHVDRAPRRPEGVLGAAALLALVVVADGAAWLGADVGGILSLVPVFALTLFVMSGRRVSWRTVALAVGATVVLLALAIGIDLLRPPDSRTHLGRFVADSSGDGDTFWTTVGRKWATNVRVSQKSLWLWMVPIVGAYATYVLVIARGWKRLVPSGSVLRAGLVGLTAAGVLGWLVNDSGVVVAALVAAFIAPYLTLLVLAGPAPAPEVLGATAAPVRRRVEASPPLAGTPS